MVVVAVAVTAPAVPGATRVPTDPATSKETATAVMRFQELLIVHGPLNDAGKK